MKQIKLIVLVLLLCSCEKKQSREIALKLTYQPTDISIFIPKELSEYYKKDAPFQFLAHAFLVDKNNTSTQQHSKNSPTCLVPLQLFDRHLKQARMDFLNNVLCVNFYCNPSCCEIPEQIYPTYCLRYKTGVEIYVLQFSRTIGSLTRPYILMTLWDPQKKTPSEYSVEIHGGGGKFKEPPHVNITDISKDNFDGIKVTCSAYMGGGHSVGENFFFSITPDLKLVPENSKSWTNGPFGSEYDRYSSETLFNNYDSIEYKFRTMNFQRIWNTYTNQRYF